MNSLPVAVPPPLKSLLLAVVRPLPDLVVANTVAPVRVSCPPGTG